MALLSQSTHSGGNSGAAEEVVELTLSKAADNDSPDFPIEIQVTTMEDLISDIKEYLDCSDPIAGIVVSLSNSVTIVTQKNKLPKEATVDTIVKKNKTYIRMTPPS